MGALAGPKVRYWWTQLLLGVAELVLGVWAVRFWQRSLFTLVTLVDRGLSGRWRGRSSHRGPPSALARDLPETALHVTSRRLMSPLSTVPLTWADVWTRRVLHGSVNRPRIDGKDASPVSVCGRRGVPVPRQGRPARRYGVTQVHLRERLSAPKAFHRPDRPGRARRAVRAAVPAAGRRQPVPAVA